jgi:hypothetical protein
MSKRRRHGAALEWLRSHVSEDGEGCLIWPFNRNNQGYGYLTAWGSRVLAHRLMCELAHGAPATGNLEAAHNCGGGRKGCCHPQHLEWKTTAENEADKLSHGTHNRGERNGQAKLTADDVRAIRRMAGAMTQEAIGRAFGVSRFLVSLILRRERWAWLD